MNDPRVEFAELTGAGDPSAILSALDSTRVIIEAPTTRTRSRSDQVALFSIVNLAARLFPHLELRVGGDAQSHLAPLIAGHLTTGLSSLARDLAPAAHRAPDHDLHLAFGMPASGDGLGCDARGWSYSVGPEVAPALKASTGPAVGAIAVGSFAVAQAFGRALGGLEMPFHPTAGFTANLLDYGNYEASDAPPSQTPLLPPTAVFGCGSLGSSFALSAVLAKARGQGVALVDPDSFSARNTLRYPVLREERQAAKVRWLAGLLRRSGIDARGHITNVNGFLNRYDDPPALDLAVVSVDTVEGRRDATDALARTTINGGVAGLALHCARHQFDEAGCAFCAYVDSEPVLKGAELLAGQIGLPVERVVALELNNGVISEADAVILAANGRFGDQPPRAGERLGDLRRRIYAQAQVPTADGAPALVSAPFVSMFAGLMMFVEAIKEADPRFVECRLAGRFDVDMSGEPPGITRALRPDASGRCLCRYPFRRRAYRRLHGLSEF